MSGKSFFLDTNIFIYTFDHTATRKQEIATELLAALECGCETLYSEDLQHKQKIESLTVINPFAE